MQGSLTYSVGCHAVESRQSMSGGLLWSSLGVVLLARFLTADRHVPDGEKEPCDRCEGVMKGKARQLMRLVGGFSCGQGKTMRGEKKDGIAFLFFWLLISV